MKCSYSNSTVFSAISFFSLHWISGGEIRAFDISVVNIKSIKSKKNNEDKVTLT